MRLFKKIFRVLGLAAVVYSTVLLGIAFEASIIEF